MSTYRHDAPSPHLEPANPWEHTAPICPVGHQPERVFLWTQEPEKWFCAECRKVFSPAAQQGTAALVADDGEGDGRVPPTPVPLAAPPGLTTGAPWPHETRDAS